MTRRSKNDQSTSKRRLGRMRFTRLPVPAFALLLAVGCEGQKAPRRREANVASEMPRAAPEPMAGAAPQPATPGSQAPAELAQRTPSAPRGRKIIRNGSLALEVGSTEKAVAEVKRMVGAEGGYVGNESESQDEYGAKSASITCRIPAEKLEGTLARLRELGKTESVSIAAEDVTEQYLDLEIRIENQARLEKRLLELLQRPTNKLTELLEIEREVARVRNEIDQLEGRKRLWDSQVAFSTLTVTLHEPRPAIASSEGGVWRTLGDSFRQAGESFVNLVAGTIASSGVLAPLGLVSWLAFRLWKKKRTKSG